jgi:hypothetical protein
MLCVVRMCPFFIVMPLVGEIVKTASMLSAIAELEIDIMGLSSPPSAPPPPLPPSLFPGSVLERMEDHKLLLDQLRTSAKSRLSVTGPALRDVRPR